MATNATYIGLGGLGLGGAFSGQSGMSDAWSVGGGESTSNANSWGNGFSDSESQQYSDAESQQYSDAYSSGYGYSDAWNKGENWSDNSSYGAVYGSEASAKDIERTYEANLWQDYFANKQMAYNTAEAEKARAYETIMSNTAYQRAIADLRKAGLNPILAAMNMGASTPVAAVATTGMANANKATTYADTRNASSGSSYGYNKGGSTSYYENQSESHGRGWSKSHSEGKSKSHSQESSGSKSTSNSWNKDMSKSHSSNTNNLKSILDGLGQMFNGLSSGMKGGGYPGDNKGTGKGWDGYDMPTVSN